MSWIRTLWQGRVAHGPADGISSRLRKTRSMLLNVSSEPSLGYRISTLTSIIPRPQADTGRRGSR